jgi:hypothetical protein
MLCRISLVSLLLIASVLSSVSSCPFRKRAGFVAAAAPKPAETKVQKSIREGIDFLRKLEDGKGDFEHTTIIARVRPGGVTALATVALLKCGVPANDPLIQRCLKYLRTMPPAQTYTISLQTMAFCVAGLKEDRLLIQKNLDWLKENRTEGGWGYDAIVKSPDHSLNFYVFLGLAEAHKAGFKIDTEMLKELRDHYQKNENGEWHYRGGKHPSLTMTSAGLFNLIASREILGEKQNAKEKEIVNRAIKWLADNFPADIERHAQLFSPFYCLHAIRCAGDRSGEKLLGKLDWRRIGNDYLLAQQKANGSWEGRVEGNLDYWPPVATSFALLFLAGGE